ncbi:hypothetical protein PVK06_043337 [Gossypium arboreum]|uniref:Transposase-associated domain-containing protein n=1 Tax=Gossypium arboreum TaxID=29729 RepID=A0ABR0MNN8_GOSAR|nr:hypothetical protein PVK06_043337 [Gossypium arboreum]
MSKCKPREYDSLPCKKCGNINWHFREVVYEHLIVDGFIQGYKKWIFHGKCTPNTTSSMINLVYPYKKWIFHGECTPSRTSSMINLVYPYNAYHQPVKEDGMDGMLWDAFNMRNHGLQSFPPDFIASDDCNLGRNAFTKTGRSVPDEELNEEEAKFYTLLNEMNGELYEGSNFLKMSFCIHLFHLKCLGGWIENSLTMLLEFLRDMFPFEKIPHSCKDMNKLIKDLGLGTTKFIVARMTSCCIRVIGKTNSLITFAVNLVG